ncbi:MAG: hypothetical protein OER85_18910, partial [Gammaproteobacteria bacterium]|nr:hypothetical protein [Gammaproteobacteria bacterium]
MTNFIAGISVLLMLTLSFWGWGSGAARILYGSTFAGWFYPAALGMSVVAVIGGVVNLLGIASPFFLWMIVASGWFLAASASRNFRVDRADLSWLLTLSATCFVLLIFLVATLMPSYVFNFHDDFHNYLARPVRMLQTGTLAGGWFDSLGWDSLGAQAYFQGLTLLVLPLEYTHGFDAVLCSALAVGLAGELSKHLGVHPLFAVAAMTFLILINPMMVNISTLYAGTVVIQGLLFAVLIWNKEMVAQQVRVPWRPSVAIGVFLATIAALKMTLAVFAAFFFFLWLLGALSLFRGKMVVLKSAITTLLAATLAIGPWIVMHKQNLQSALMQFIAGQPDD